MHLNAELSWLVLFYKKKLFLADMIAAAEDGGLQPLITAGRRHQIEISHETKWKGWKSDVSFFALPSLSRPRLFLAAEAVDFSRELYMPRRFWPRVMYGIICSLASVGVLRFIYPILRINTPSRRNDLADLLAEEMGLSNATFSISVGTPGPERKLTLTVSDDERLVGFLKIADSPVTRALLENEFRMARALSQTGRADLAPDLLFDRLDGEYLFLMQSTLEGQRCPIEFEACHEEFLLKLRKGTDLLLEETMLYPLLISRIQQMPELKRWKSFLEDAAKRTVRDAFLHGDFAPWNVRLRHSSLVAFDWEYGIPSAVWGIDQFHYLLNVRFVLHDRSEQAVLKELMAIVEDKDHSMVWRLFGSHEEVLLAAKLSLLLDISGDASREMSILNRRKMGILSALP